LPISAVFPPIPPSIACTDIKVAFGGDPTRIVLGGHSSGSVQVDHYLWNHPSTPLAGALEMSANSASGPVQTPPNVGLDLIATELGCPSGSGQLSCLRTKSISAIENTSNFNSTTNTWFSPIVDGKTRYSVADYAKRFKAGQYPKNVPLITGNSNGEGTIFGLVYSFENTNFSSWISTFDADSAHVPASSLEAAYNISTFTSPSPIFTSTSLMSGTQYGDARFNCPVDYLIDLRASLQKTWEYRWFGAYDNIVGVPGTAPTHGTEIPFFLGGNECFDSLAGVTVEEQKLADFTNDWFVAWIKNPKAGPGWDQVDANPSPSGGTVMNLGVSGRETQFVKGKRSDHNGICQSVSFYNPVWKVSSANV
jgi:carboxylesterase type B